MAALEWRVRSTRMPVESLAAAVVDPERLVVVATSGEELVGWAKTHYWDWSDGPAGAGHYLGGVTVDTPWRRRGVAAALTEARMEWIGERADAAWYVVNGRNLASVALHRAWGFEEVARASRFHTVEFTGGVGILFRAALPRRTRS
ncbi:GNAT family N-acetyltransferase [uncultured Cellulomonas sp.]|uniref:GNAT family N-acetyltransferase n=1 Tax=uncultured Cellulomonas sp. TaxID=189682 RepID=UPI0026293151|nr:GNAT family N-acetyltransferase [uncultured Cellulomonas sp.]